MELWQVPLLFSRLPMFPFFDLAHYVASVMALKEQRGVVEVSVRSPVACWFSAMLNCFGGSVLSSLMLAEPPIAFLAKGTNILLASSVWYLVFYCPQDIFYRCFAFLPVRLLVAGMKEVTRTWKITAGVAHADSHFRDAWLVMVAVGWARGAGGGLISNFEQLVRGVWKPETNELLKMSYAYVAVMKANFQKEEATVNNNTVNPNNTVLTGAMLEQCLLTVAVLACILLLPGGCGSGPVKVTLIGAVLFTLQHSQYLPMARHNLMFLYTVFLIVCKVTMMLTRSATSPFAPFEAALGHMFFGLQKTPPKVKGEGAASSNGSSVCDRSSEQHRDGAKKRQAKKTE